MCCKSQASLRHAKFNKVKLQCLVTTLFEVQQGIFDERETGTGCKLYLVAFLSVRDATPHRDEDENLRVFELARSKTRTGSERN